MSPLRFLATKDTGHRSTPAHFFGGMIDEYLFGRGWFGKTFLEGGAFVKSAAREPIPDIQFHSIPWAYPEPNDDGPGDPVISTEHSFTILPGLIYPKSRGEVRLVSSDPFAAPSIDPHYFEAAEDLELLVTGVKMSREIANSKPLAAFLKEEATPGPATKTDDEIRAAIQLYAKTIYHPVGTCKMGVDAMAVVDPELRVRGIDGLRIADASIMPSITGGNTNAPSIMIGEKASDSDSRSQGAAGPSFRAGRLDRGHSSAKNVRWAAARLVWKVREKPASVSLASPSHGNPARKSFSLARPNRLSRKRTNEQATARAARLPPCTCGS